MSVLKKKQHQSPMTYVTNAYDIQKDSLDFIKRLTVKNARLYQKPVMRLAMLQADTAYIANEIFPTNLAEYQIRRILHAVSMAVLHALDKRMGDVYEMLMVNPQEAFNRQNGKPIPKAEAIAILDKMAENLGTKIDDQDTLLKGIRDSDKSRFSKLPAADPAIFDADAIMKNIVDCFIKMFAI